MKNFLIIFSVSLMIIGGIFLWVGTETQTTTCSNLQETLAWSPQNTTKQCPRCVGTGRCGVCGGRGYFVAMGSGEKRACRTCHGSGTCQSCGGTGRVSVK